MKPKIELAPQEQLLFVRKLLPIFLDRILGHPEALVTDMTKVTHFVNYDIEESIGKGSKPGHYLFKIQYKVVRKNVIALRESGEEYEDVIWDIKAIHGRKWIIRKCKRFFGVDITDCYYKEIPIVLKYIMMKMSRKKAIELGLIQKTK
ncbi:MAG TPA: hypothetical protein PK079_24855 [Leptospiraceae bacterium]|nr:hypothetical protein [Leptospiraceae bacterium]HMW08681.1 hypothetical protein [Leptospiraceae bacterium]HMX34934.1 hypothetical protein [Leptospiraceae bacterium]HMY34394.1 hypothetical protein [Leptospiraceae bacterium]HMZ67199.1 hypothetical protein [Leptospiraceae bacterium]